MNQIRPPSLHHLRTPHLRQIQTQRNVIIERENKPLRVFNVVSKYLLGQLFLGRFGIDRKNIHSVARLGKVAQEFVEPVGVSGNVGEGGWFDEECDGAGRAGFERGDYVQFRGGVKGRLWGFVRLC